LESEVRDSPVARRGSDRQV